MRTTTTMLGCLALWFFSAVSIAQPDDPPVVKFGPRITAENADRLKVVQEIDKDVRRILKGPGRGELSLLMWEKPVEVISEIDFHPKRTIADGYLPVTFSFSPSAALAAWAENNSTVVVWDMHKDEKLLIEAENAQPSVAFSSDGQWIVTGGYGSHAKVWNREGLLVRLLETGIEGGLTPVFSPDGKILVVGNRNGETRLFDIESGAQLRVLPRRLTQGLAFHPDGKTLAVAYVKGEVGLWDVDTGALIHCEPSGAAEIYSVDWSPEGDVLVSAGKEGKIVLWNPEGLTKITELEGPEWVIQARFSSDGTHLFTAGGSVDGGKKDRKIRVWAVESGAE